MEQAENPAEVLDRELLEASQRGISGAFEVLFERHAPGLRRLAMAMTRSRTDADDVVQEAFMGAYRGLRNFQGRSTVGAWLSRILSRQAAKFWNRRSRQMRIELKRAMHAGRTGYFAPAIENQMDVVQLLAGLEPMHRQVIILRDLEGRTCREVARMLQVAEGTVESRLCRARGRLREQIERARKTRRNLRR